VADDAKKDQVQDELDKLSAMAKRLGLKGKDITDYVHDHMTRLGYKSRRSYYRDDKSSGTTGARSWWRGGGDSNNDDDNDTDED
jgi:hypothetical protein